MRAIKYILITLLLMTCSCAARRTDGTVNFNASLTESLLSFEVTYEIILINIGDAYRAGLIPFETREQGRFLGQRAYNSIEAAKVSLAIYLQTQRLGSYDEFATSLAVLSILMIQLERFHVEHIGSAP